MSAMENFFAFGFISVFAVFLLATWFRYLPTLVNLYRIIMYKQANRENYLKDNFNF